jgi:hypothetical protein
MMKAPTHGLESARSTSTKRSGMTMMTKTMRQTFLSNGSIECIEAIEAMLNKEEYIGYLRGNALKYRWRFRYKKKPFEDLRKARWYEERLMKFLLDNQDAV